ncbi:DcpS C and/or HIT domain containing protein [Asbolus verrucosus]|uniref:DcpS C and/or HIT domain containing protein n=1 Tax=Asbolus verrucosus TaxID=1661398 RepID=A0A482WAK0_ASBVE|nr:DcpS C and/or HIT domain containing protein [Asbolus verrucosus]
MSKRKSDATVSNENTKKSKTSGHWSQGLLSSVDDPNYFVKSDDMVNVIKDKYPKAKYHYLVIAKENISSLKSVTIKHAALLKHMEDVGLEIVNDKKHKGNIEFKIGYHAEPSMSRLHLHVISDDMVSDFLKTKKHWNSFTSEFFLRSQGR